MKATFQQWKEYLQQYPDTHVLQLAEWGELKSHFGWSVERIISQYSGAQILFRHLPLGFSIGYIPKGPLGNPDPTFWQETSKVCNKHRAIFLKIEPNAWQNEPITYLPEDCVASDPIQPRQTATLDLSQSPEAILAGMKQKTRYNIQLAAKKDVVVSPSTDVRIFAELMRTTSERDRFGVHQEGYYRRCFDLFKSDDHCELFVATYQQLPLAGVMVFRSGKRSWYFYGASSNMERNRMPAYLLQWKAIEWAMQHGCESYDLWGIPDAPAAELEQQFESRNDGLWGVYRFKRGFNGTIKRSSGAFDLIFQPVLYHLYKFLVSIRKDVTA